MDCNIQSHIVVRAGRSLSSPDRQKFLKLSQPKDSRSKSNLSMPAAAMLKYVVEPSDRIVKIFPKRQLVVIDPSFYTIYNFNIRVFVLLHELAHLETANEYEADYKAYCLYRDAGYPLRDCIFALTRVLPMPKNYQRVSRLFGRIIDECPELVN